MNQEQFNRLIHQQMSSYHSDMPFWVSMIRDLVDGAGYSYSRIAYRLEVSPSTIQKLATKWHRKPRHYLFHQLLLLYYKVFYSDARMPRAAAYLEAKNQQAAK